jgi:hypothetical protein
MRVDLCAREDYPTQAKLLEAFAVIGAYPDDDRELEVPLPCGLLRFRVGSRFLTVFSDAWAVDLEGPDELVNRVLAELREAG